MSNQDGNASLFGNSGFKIVCLVLLLAGASWYGWGLYGKYAKGLPPPPAATQDVTNMLLDRRPSPEQMRTEFNEIMQQLQFTNEQDRQIRKLFPGGAPQSFEDLRRHGDELRKIATPAQQDQFRQIIRSRFMARFERMRQTMTPEDFATVQRRFMERRANRGQRGGAPPR